MATKVLEKVIDWFVLVMCLAQLGIVLLWLAHVSGVELHALLRLLWGF